GVACHESPAARGRRAFLRRVAAPFDLRAELRLREARRARAARIDATGRRRVALARVADRPGTAIRNGGRAARVDVAAVDASAFDRAVRVARAAAVRAAVACRRHLLVRSEADALLTADEAFVARAVRVTRTE